jgi:hypothetical protein
VKFCCTFHITWPICVTCDTGDLRGIFLSISWKLNAVTDINKILPYFLYMLFTSFVKTRCVKCDCVFDENLSFGCHDVNRSVHEFLSLFLHVLSELCLIRWTHQHVVLLSRKAWLEWNNVDSLPRKRVTFWT